jgi:hypothetical protein
MTKSRMLALLVVAAHWMDAVGHLFLAAKILPAPNDHVSWLAVILMAALSADLYEHFLHASGNNVFMVAPGHWRTWFDASVVVLLALEILGCSIGTWLLSSRMRRGNSAPGVSPNLNRRGLRFSASLS